MRSTAHVSAVVAGFLRTPIKAISLSHFGAEQTGWDSAAAARPLAAESALVKFIEFWCYIVGAQ